MFTVNLFVYLAPVCFITFSPTFYFFGWDFYFCKNVWRYVCSVSSGCVNLYRSYNVCTIYMEKIFKQTITYNKWHVCTIKAVQHWFRIQKNSRF